MKNNFFKIKFLTEILNKYADAYYNNTPIATDEEYDSLYKQLEELEKETGFKLSNSPIDRVGFKIQDNIKKAIHSSPMLSLSKIHSVQEIIDFAQDKECVMSLKEDGLTVRLTYENGILVKAETRGDGEVGSDITYNASAIQCIPQKINNLAKIIIDGEVIVTAEDFAKVNETMDVPFKLQRSLASGSVALLDPNVTKKRRLTFIAWKFVGGAETNTYSQRFEELLNMGFNVVPYLILNTDYVADQIEMLRNTAKENGHPIDGIVITYNDIDYGDSLGRTEHHFNSGTAYKFDDEIFETTLLRFDWTMGRTGVLTPTAIFNTVIIDGTQVSRASCHNLSYCKNMCLGIGDKIGVYKADMIIPQIKVNYTNSRNFEIPLICPYCGTETYIKSENDVDNVYCPNELCNGKQLGKLTHYVSKAAMNIDGLSQSTLKILIENHYIKTFIDIYNLESYFDDLVAIKGFGKRKVEKMIQAVENSRKCYLSNFLVALGIPLIGKSASKIISKECNGDIHEFIKRFALVYDWTIHDGFGPEMNKSLYLWMSENYDSFIQLTKELEFIIPKSSENNTILNKNFCITGSLEHHKNRNELVKKIEDNGGNVTSTVTQDTNYLICNKKSTSSKYKKAESLGISIITELDFIKLLKE